MKKFRHWAILATLGILLSLLASQSSDRLGITDERGLRAQQSEQDRESDRSRSSRWRRWFDSENSKNHSEVKDAFAVVAGRAMSGTVQVLVDGDVAALGTVVEADGYIVSKASLLEGSIRCRLADGRLLDAELVGTDDDHDLALLKVAATNLPSVPWRDGAVTAGTMVAAVGSEQSPLGIGMISTEARTIRDFGAYNPNRGRLGISLDVVNTAVSITQVESDSGAEKAGLLIGDVIIDIDGTSMMSISQVVQTVGSHRPGQTIKVRIRRDDKELTVTATLGKPPMVASPEDEWGGGPFSARRAGFPTALPHDVIIQPNQCGGPLVDTDGTVVGINIARALRVTTLALPADTVQRLVQDLKEKQAGI
jgi:serine protease Do